RRTSERLARAAERGMIAAGVAVERVGVVPTPALYYAVASRGLAGGMMITASHNPPEFNGFKMTKRKLPLYGAEILGMRHAIQAGELAPGAGGWWTAKPVLDAYRAMLIEKCASPKGLRVVMDCGNGCAGTVVPQVFEKMGHTVIPLFAELDGRFPNHLPDPTVPALLVDLQKKVKETG